jgi:eukaryotic-like serine/threonine-protein kinase
VRWLRETAIALDCAHEHDVVHRDVKPANLLLDEQERLAVGDFGIATVASEASVTQTGQVLGTAAYIAPEQARGLPATAASDRYALAVVAFELLTGARPFNVDHPAAQARAHVQATVPAASEVGDDLPPAVDAALRAGLAKDPDARPETAEDLVDRIEDALDDDTTATAVAPPTATTRRFERPAPAAAPPREARPRRTPPPPPSQPARAASGDGPRRWPAIAALAALLLAAGAVAAIALTGGTSNDRTTARSPSATTSTAKKRRTTSSSRSTSTQQRQTTTQSQSTPTTSSAPATASGGDPKALNDRGFALIGQGNNAAAVPLLQQSVQGFREQGRTGEIDYAFALFNLATALRATGHPDQAIPLLEERLQRSDYKRAEVQGELAAARQQAGQPASNAPAGKAKKDKSGKGGNRGHGNGEGDD